MSDTVMTGISLRTATPDDWPAVEALLTGEHLPLSGARDHLGDFVVAVSGSIVGCVGVERYGQAGLLRSLAVTPAKRGAGIGKALVHACIDHARDTGVQTLALLTETAEEFFRRMGFARVERELVPAAVQASSEFRGACPASAVAMVRNLSPAGDHN